MKVAIHSDLHLEGNRLPEGFGSNQEEVQVVVLAGDIGVRDLGKNLEDIRKAYPTQPILFCPGNHEYYGYEFHERNEEMRAICKNSDIFFMSSDHGFTYFDEATNEDYYFIGSTFWSDMEGATEEEKRYAQQSISDFYRIRYEGRAFTIDDMIAESTKEKANLKRILGLTLDEDIFDGKVVVVGHFPPLRELGNPIFPKNALTYYFHNNWERLIWKADAWIYGHTHYNSPMKEYNEGCGRYKTKFLSNQRGYNKEESNQVYRPDHVVEI